jgi:hypothetical protein
MRKTDNYPLFESDELCNDKQQIVLTRCPDVSPDYARSHGDPVASSSRIRAKGAGAFAEFLLSALAVFLVPALLDIVFALNIPMAWGMGDFAFVLCAAGLIPGWIFYRKLAFP